MSYDTSLKHLYRVGLEEVIPPHLRKQIPRSTIHRWRHEADEKYVGFELNKLASSELELLKEFARSRNARRIFTSYVRMGRFLQEVAGDKHIKRLLKERKEDLIDVIERAKENMPMNQVLRCFNLSRSTYNTWVMSLYGDCKRSAINWCKIRHPHQLKAEEVEVMRELLTDKKMEHWPISSVAHHAQREGLLFLARSTWYKYANLMGLRRQAPKKTIIRKRKGLRANAPNEIWHADVTYFRVGGKLHYIYLVVDNYSRKILSSLVSSSLSATNRLKTIQHAYENAFGSLYPEMQLVVDGGSENNNKMVNKFVNEQQNLRKLIALKDIPFSNNQVESHNKLLKYSYLYRIPIRDENELKRAVKHAIHEFNNIRPFDALGGMTPAEAYEELPNYMQRFGMNYKIQEARLDRCKTNRCSHCSDCPFRNRINPTLTIDGS